LIGTLLVCAGWAAWTLLATDPLAEVRAAMDRRDFDAADDLLARRLRDRPTDPAVRLLAARSARRVGDLRAAAAHLDAAYRHGGATDAYEQEARLFRAQTDERVADKLLEEYDSNPDAADAHQLLEAYLEGKLRAVGPMGAGGTTIEAEEAALAAVARSEADLYRAVALWLAARPADADQAQGHLWRARISFAANKHPQGVEALQKAVEFAPESSDARFQLALAVQLRSPDEARRHLETLLDRQPDNPYFRLGLANTYRMLGRGADARRLYDGLTDGNLRVDALVELGTLDLEDGRLTDAERRLRAALDAAPNAAPAVMAMSRLHHLAGRPAEAARFRQRFDELEAARKAAATRPR
jgi:tetratricopeptide (TPR) repeat protein